MLTRLDHIDLKVPNIDAAVEFLTRIGLQVIRPGKPEGGSIALALPGEGQVIVEIREDPKVTQTTLNHIAFTSDGLDSDADSLEASGVTVTKRPTLIGHSGRTISNFADPSGKSWQLTD